jgi:hypothetical protein
MFFVIMKMHKIKIEEHLCITPLKTLTILFSETWWSDAVALYFFYYKQCKIQSTDSSWSTKKFCMKWLWRWETRFDKAKKILKRYSIIEDIRHVDPVTKLVKWRYIKLNYISNSPPPPETTRVDGPPGGYQSTNAYVKEDKCLSKKNKYKNYNKKILLNNWFEEFWELYPIKKWKAKAREYRNKKINKPEIEIILQKVKDMISEYKRKQRMDNFAAEYKHPWTWINQECRDDEYEASKVIKPKQHINIEDIKI